jgi:murein L,D-transpeptidase YcbB/YkuD
MALDRPTSSDRAAAAADLDLLLTDAFLVLGSHYLAGHVDPTTVTTEWVANRRNMDMAGVLTTALASGQPGEALRALLPPQPGYARLRTALVRYRAVQTAGGWPTVEPGPTLRPGDGGPRVEALQARLVASGDLAPGSRWSRRGAGARRSRCWRWGRCSGSCR